MFIHPGGMAARGGPTNRAAETNHAAEASRAMQEATNKSMMLQAGIGALSSVNGSVTGIASSWQGMNSGECDLVKQSAAQLGSVGEMLASNIANSGRVPGQD